MTRSILGRSRLLLKRFAQIVGALAQLVEQARVLDGDDGLGSEIANQLDLLVGKRPDLPPVDADCTNHFVFF